MFENGSRIAWFTALLVIFFVDVSHGMGAAPRLPQISIEGQSASLSPMMLGVGSVFLTIKNSGNDDDNLIGAKLSIPGAIAEIHDVKDSKMVKIDKVQIASQGVVKLKPRSLHIMIFKIPKDIKEGYEFTLHLVFEKSGEKQVPVKFARGAESPMRHKH